MSPEKKTILVVDDEPEIRSVTQFFLRERGFNVVEAADGKIAHDYLKKHRVDLVLTDQRMPNMSGIELAQHILTGEHPVPVIIVTGFSDIPEEYAHDLGVKQILKKPLDMDVLVAAIRRHLVR